MSILHRYGRRLVVELDSHEKDRLDHGDQIEITDDRIDGVDNLIIMTDADGYNHETDPSKRYEEYYHRDGVTLKMMAGWRQIAIVLVEEFRPASSIDLGCSGGGLVRELKSLGVEAIGIDGSAPAQKVMPEIRLHDLRVKLPVPWELGSFDLVTCSDVAEHIELEFADVVASHAADAAKPGGWVVFGAATPGQGGLGHVNLQEHSWWRDRLERCGLVYHEDRTIEFRRRLDHTDAREAWWWQKNAQIFRR